MSLLKPKNTRAVTLPKVATPDGCYLIFGEAERHVPFPIKRFYYIAGFSHHGMKRGGHAHKTFEQVMFCLVGRFTFHLDDGTADENVEMSEPNKGVYFGPGVWHDMVDIAAGSLILVVASHTFDEADYIRDYQQFLKFVKA